MKFVCIKTKEIMKRKNVLFFVLLSVLLMFIEVRADEKLSENDIKLAEIKLIVDTEITNKVLKDPSVPYCKILLEAKPVENVAKMLYSLDNAKIFMFKMKKLVDSHCGKSDTDDIEVHFEKAKKSFMSTVVSPISAFLETMHEYKDFLVEMSRESVNGYVTSFESSMTYRFLSAGKAEASNFFEKHINSMKDLCQTTKELIALLGDFEKSMPEAFKKGRARLDEIRKAKKTEKK